MKNIVARKSILRKPSRGELVFLAVLVLFFGGTGSVGSSLLFAPFDWLQQRTVAQINERPYDGDGVLVSITEDTLTALDRTRWTKAELAELLTVIRQAGPSQIVVSRQYFSGDDQLGTDQLRDALSSLEAPVFWEVNLAPEDVVSLRGNVAPPRGSLAGSNSTKLDPSVRGLVTPTAMTLRRYPVSAPLKAPYTVVTLSGNFPSTAQVLSDGPPPRSNVFDIDLAYDPATIPTLDAAALLSGEAQIADLRNKRIVIANANNLARDFFSTPNGGAYTSRGAATLMGAQSLSRGPPVRIGWVPALVASTLGAVAWVFLTRPWGRLVALTMLIAILASTVLLERQLIFQSTSQGVFLILVLAVGKVWVRGREAVQIYRSAAETKSRFLAQASHDLRQPIHAIGLLSERLSQTDLSTDQSELVKKISWSVDNASRMFRALLDIAAIESGTLQTDIAPVSINELLAEIDSQNALAAEQAGVDLHLVPSSLIVKTDRVLVGTMLQNLVSNAIKYAPGGKVVVGCRRRGDRVAIHVVDNGRGISSAELEHVAKEFYRSSDKSILRSENKGLGLAIVNRLSVLLKLSFALSSREGEGTSAVIGGLLCIEDPVASDMKHTAKRLPLAGLRVALADDDQETLRSTERLLEQWGCDVTSFDHFPEDHVDHDILLTDFDFGDGDTLSDRAQALKAISDRGICVIILSGHHQDTIRDSLPGITHLILSKPLRPAELRSALMSARIG